MMRYIFILIIFIANFSYAQQMQYMGSANTRVVARGQLKVDSLLSLPGRDTSFTPYTFGSMIFKTSDSKPYVYDGSIWRSLSPNGSNKNIQFNNSGSFEGSNSLTWDNSLKEFYVNGRVNVNGPLVSSKDSVPTLSSVGTNMLLFIDTATGRVQRMKKGDLVNGAGATGFNGYPAFRSLAVQDTNSVYVVRANNVSNLFRYDSTSTGADDSAMTIVGANGKRYRRITDGVINAAWFGVVADDNLDDSKGFQKLWNYIDTVTSLKEYKIFIPGGRYDINTSVTLPQNVSISASNPRAKIYVEASGVRIHVTGAITGWQRKSPTLNDANLSINNYVLSIHGLEFVGDYTTGQKGMEIHSLYGAEFSDMRFTSLDTGFVVRFILGSIFKNNFFTNNKSVGFLATSLSGYATNADVANSAFNANQIVKNRIYCYNASFAGMMIMAGDGNNFLDNVIEGGKPRYSFYYDYQGSSVVNGNQIQGMWFETNSPGVNNVAMKIANKGIFKIDRVQNDYKDTIIDWSNSAGSSVFVLDNLEFWDFPTKYIKGVPAGALQLRLGTIYGTNYENFFDTAYYDGGRPDEVYGLMPYQNGNNGSAWTSARYITIKPSLNFTTNLRNLYIRGNTIPDTLGTGSGIYNLGSSAMRWNYSYINKGLFNLSGEDGSGAAVQVGGSLSIANGQFVRSASMGRVGFTSNGTEVGDQNGVAWNNLRINFNSGISWLVRGAERLRVDTNGLMIYRNTTYSSTSGDTLLIVRNDSVKRKGQNDLFTSATYTPTVTSVTNIQTATATTTYYQRVGDVVTVFGEITIDPTATGDTHIRITLPVSATISQSYQLAGNGSAFDVNQTLRVYGDTANNAAILRLLAADANSHVYSYQFKYKL